MPCCNNVNFHLVVNRKQKETRNSSELFNCIYAGKCGVLTHSYLLNNEERPECIPCNSNHSLKHVFIDCVDVADARQTFYNVNSLSNVFTNVAGTQFYNF
jgi:hypothetical protein